MQPILVVTRPHPQNDVFATSVRAALGSDVETILAPAFTIAPVAASGDFERSNHVIFTSVNGVRHAPMVAGALAWCVGEVTAKAAEALGYQVRTADGDADALAVLMLKARPDGVITHFAGRYLRGDIVGQLQAAGLMAQKITVYSQIELAPPARLVKVASGRAPLVLSVFSSRSGLAMIKLSLTAPVHLVAISTAVADDMSVLLPKSLLTLDKPDADEMVNATAHVIKRLQAGNTLG